MNAKSPLCSVLLCLLFCAASELIAAEQSSSQRWEPEIRAFEAVDRANAPPQDSILFVGSSTIRMWKTLAQDFPQYKVLNRGFGGCQIADCTYYADRIVVPYQPRLIVLRAGGNDIAAGKTPEQVCVDFQAFVDNVRAKLPKIRIAYMTINATPARWANVEREKKANRLIKECIVKGENLDYIDTFDATMGADGKPRKELFVRDRLHFNAEGYKILASEVHRHLPRARAEEEGKVYNGSFEKTAASGRAPDGWQAEGDKGVVQELALDQDPKRSHVARLRCTRFVPGTSSTHVMIAQVGHVGVRNGRWYRLSLWARASDLAAGAVQVGLANFRTWSAVGLSGSFVPTEEWQPFEFVFRAEQDLKPADSRLAIYFLSTGTLWLDDVTMEQTTEPRRQWLPAIPMAGVTNALPNSSFEGGEGWGCSASKNYDWTANLFQRVGQWDESQAFHGKRSWKVTLSAGKPLMIYGGYTLLAAEVRNLELGHAGWVRVEPGQPCVFSVYVKSDRVGTPVRVSLKEPEDWRPGRSKHGGTSLIGQAWQRFEVSHTPKGEFVRGCLVFDLPEGEKGERTLWIDAAQFERGTSATPYHPRAELEAVIETGVTGNIFTDPSKGLCFRLRAFNDSKLPKAVAGRLRVTDFWDRTVWEEHPDLVVTPGQSAERTYAVLAGRSGFFRIHWEPEGGLCKASAAR